MVGVGLCFVVQTDYGQAGELDRAKLSIRKSRRAGLMQMP
jgi:hypothetical protein